MAYTLVLSSYDSQSCIFCQSRIVFQHLPHFGEAQTHYMLNSEFTCMTLGNTQSSTRETMLPAQGLAL